MRKIYILLLAYSLLSLFAACNDNDYKASVTELRLVLVKPTNVYSGEIATILGRNFSTVPEENAVFINDQQATVIEAFKDELKIILPEMAPGKYSIRVKSPSGELTGLELNYLKTYISLRTHIRMPSWDGYSPPDSRPIIRYRHLNRQYRKAAEATSAVQSTTLTVVPSTPVMPMSMS